MSWKFSALARRAMSNLIGEEAVASMCCYSPEELHEAGVAFPATFFPGRNGALITRVGGDVDSAGMVCFPEWRGKQPKDGEAWMVRVVGFNRRGTVCFLRLVCPAPSDDELKAEVERLQLEREAAERAVEEARRREWLAAWRGTDDPEVFAVEFAEEVEGCEFGFGNSLWGKVSTPQGYYSLYGETPEEVMDEVAEEGDAFGTRIIAARKEAMSAAITTGKVGGRLLAEYAIRRGMCKRRGE